MTRRCWCASGRPWETTNKPIQSQNGSFWARISLFNTGSLWYSVSVPRDPASSVPGKFHEERTVYFMVIDIHTHTFPDKLAATTIPKLEGMSHTRAYVDGTVSGLRASMSRAGVDLSFVLPVATNPRQVVHVNDSSARINDQGRETGIYSFGCMHPDFSDYRAELARVKELGMKGIKLHRVYQGVNFDDIRTLRILDRAAELGLVVLTHSGLDIGFPGEVRVTPAMVLHAIREVGPLTLILAHMGGWRNWDQVEELLPEAPVYLDTSYSLGSITPLDDGYYRPEDLPMMGEEQFLRIIRTFGYERFLFGTDSPWSGQKESVERLRALPLTQEEKAAILGGNAQRLLQIPERA